MFQNKQLDLERESYAEMQETYVSASRQCLAKTVTNHCDLADIGYYLQAPGGTARRCVSKVYRCLTNRIRPILMYVSNIWHLVLAWLTPRHL